MLVRISVNTSPGRLMFYDDIPPFGDFSEVTERRHYRPMPDDWLLTIADIEGSTSAIAAGRYKDVNMVGAACITAVLNVRGDNQLPYVFGGDGATLAIPPQLRPAATRALQGVRHMARQQFGLELRVGMMPVADIRSRGQDVRVARFELSQGNYLATFSGGGAELADQLIKESGHYLIDEEAPADADLEGLSCRWQPLHSRNGVILSMLVHASADQQPERVYQQVIARTSALMATDEEKGRPISHRNMHLRWPPQRIDTEIRATLGRHNRMWWSLRVRAASLLHYLLDRFDISAGNFHPGRYRQELRQNSDYRRFDDMLRILFDCSNQQADQIEAMLRTMQQQGQLSYGLHRTDRALMTCIVFDLSQSEHIHFLDGDRGGFAMAARQLKDQQPGSEVTTDPQPESSQSSSLRSQ